MAPSVGIGTTVIKIMKTCFRQKTGFYLSCVSVIRPLDLSSCIFFNTPFHHSTTPFKSLAGLQLRLRIAALIVSVHVTDQS
jgi:hypothetical protein